MLSVTVMPTDTLPFVLNKKASRSNRMVHGPSQGDLLVSILRVGQVLGNRQVPLIHGITFGWRYHARRMACVLTTALARGPPHGAGSQLEDVDDTAPRAVSGLGLLPESPVSLTPGDPQETSLALAAGSLRTWPTLRHRPCAQHRQTWVKA